MTETPTFTPAERERLRSLASQVAEAAARPIEKRKAERWTAHNDLRSAEPLIFCDPENGWNEIIPASALACSDPLARAWEMRLRKEIFWAFEMLDDRVVEPFFELPYVYEDTGWGLHEKRIGGDHGGSYTWEPPLVDYDRDYPSLAAPMIIVDRGETNRLLGLAHELFDGILKIRLRGNWWWTLGMTWDYINLRGLESFMLDLYDNPDWVHKMMKFMSEGLGKKLDFLEAEGLLSLNTGGSYVGSGGFGWSGQLPAAGFDPMRVRTIDMWGFAESQETVGISAEMFGEFIFPYQLPLLERFGLNCYGCCEPLDSRWQVVRRIPRLRRVSVSPWSDAAKMAEALGGDYIMSIKPNPAALAQSELDEDAIRTSLQKHLRAARAKGCIVELIMKDNHTLGGNPGNATGWCRIAREEIGSI